MHTFINVDLEDFAIPRDLLPLALGTPVFRLDLLALSFTVGADALALLDEPGCDLLHLHLHAGSATALALLRRALLATASYKHVRRKKIEHYPNQKY